VQFYFWQKTALGISEEKPTIRETSQLPAEAGSGSSRTGGWPEAVRRPEDGKLINSTNGLLLEDAGNQIGNPFSLFNLVRFPNTECTTDTGGVRNLAPKFKYCQKKRRQLATPSPYSTWSGSPTTSAPRIQVGGRDFGAKI
jgi:hypothetical protein